MEQKTWNKQVTFDQGRAPSPELFAGERIVGTIEAELWDIGLIGYLTRRKDRVVITTHRIFQYSINMISTRLRCLELAKIEIIEVGSKLNLVQFIVGLVLILSAPILFGSSLFQPGAAGRLMSVYGLLSALAGLFVLLTSWKRVLQASGSGARSIISLPLASIGVNASKGFVDLVSGAIRNLSKASPPPSLPLHRESAEKVVPSLNGDESPFKKSPAMPATSKQVHQEPDGTLNYSSNGEATAENTSASREDWQRARRTYIE